VPNPLLCPLFLFLDNTTQPFTYPNTTMPMPGAWEKRLKSAE
jgi:hypothetical protein